MTKLKFYTIALIHTLVWNFALGQTYVNYTVKDGLPSNHVYRVTQDKAGFIWVITDGGVSRFDGETFTNFTVENGMPTNDIWNIRITPDQKVWYFSKNAQLGYIYNDSVYKFSTKDNEILYPKWIHRYKNNITLLREDFYHTFENNQWVKHPLTDAPYKLPNTNFQEYFHLYKPQVSYQNGLVYIYKGSKGFNNKYRLNDSIWVLENITKTTIIDFKNNSVNELNLKQDTTFKNQLKNPRFHEVNGEIQFTGEHFLGSLNTNLQFSEVHHIPTELESHFSFKDKDNNIWVATFNKGLYKIPAYYNEIQTYFKGQDIEALNNVDGTLYFSVKDKGVYKIKDQVVEKVVATTAYVHGIYKVLGRVFVSDQQEILEIKNKVAIHYGRDNYFYSVKYLLEYDGFIWAYGNNSFMSKLNNDLKSQFFNGVFSALFVNKNRLFRINTNRLEKYAAEDNNFQPFNNLRFKPTVNTVATYNDHNYLGTDYSGLYVFKNDSIVPLLDNDKSSINHIAVENDQRIWTISSGMLQLYHATKNGSFEKLQIPEFNGFNTSQLNKILIYNNTLYLASVSGLHSIDLNSIDFNTKFKPYIKSIRINNAVSRSKYLEVSYNYENTINIEQGTLNFSGLKTQFAYKLSPIQKQWNTTNTGEINLLALAPGDYNLQLKSRLNTVDKVINLPMKIMPLWYQTKTARFFFVCIFIAFLVVLFFYLLKRQERLASIKLARQKQLSELQLKALRSQMNPHFVFNSLAAIQYYINQNDIDTSDAYLVKFSRLIRQFFDNSQKNLITIAEEVQLLKNYLDVEKLRFKDEISYTIEASQELHKREMPTMLLQPIVENAINHGLFNKEAHGEIRITFTEISEQLKISIQDDGVGVKATKQKKGKGKHFLSVLEERLYFLNQTKQWHITYDTDIPFPEQEYCGHRVLLSIKKL